MAIAIAKALPGTAIRPAGRPVGVMPDRRPPRGASLYQEEGSTGLKHYSGRLYEEFLPDLQGIRAVRIWREMSDNDAVVNASLYALTTLMRRAQWRVDPFSESDPADAAAANYVKECLHDMEQSWADTIGEVLSFLPYGWAYHEQVFKPRQGFNADPRYTSKYDDGLIGWRKFPIRAQETLFRWEIDPGDGTIWGLWQQPPPNYDLRYVRSNKALHFRTTTYKNNPEGRSILRGAYRAWYFKRRLEEIEAIGLERSLAGMPVIQPPEEVDIFDRNDPQAIELLALATDIVTNLRRDELEGVVLPAGWSLTLLSAGGAHGQAGGRSSQGSIEIQAAIQRYEQHEAMSLLADFIMLGHESTGTYALSSDKTDMFNLSVNSWLDYVAGVFNRWAIPLLMRLNPRFPQDRFPTLAHDGVDTPNMSEIGGYIATMTGCGILVPDPGIEDYVRSIGNLPTRPTDETDDEWQERHSLVPQDELDSAQEETDDAKQQALSAGQQAQAHRTRSETTQRTADLKIQQANLKTQQARLDAKKKTTSAPARKADLDDVVDALSEITTRLDAPARPYTVTRSISKSRDGHMQLTETHKPQPAD